MDRPRGHPSFRECDRAHVRVLIGDQLYILRKRKRVLLRTLDVLWQRGEGTVQDVCDQLGRPLAYTTVMTTLRLLHSKKKVLKRVKRGRAHVHQPVVSRDDVSSSVICDMKTVLFGDRLPTLVLGLLENGRFSPAEINELKTALKNVENRDGIS